VSADTLESWRVKPRAEADWPALLDLWVASWRATYAEIDFHARRDWFIRHVSALEAGGAVTFCLFETPETLAGFVVIDPATGWLDQICVHPHHFGAGAAAALIACARNASPGRIRLDVNADNARALRFYERQGFASVGAGPASLSGRPTVVMEWRGAGADHILP
jgi:putative acetyltransferase